MERGRVGLEREYNDDLTGKHEEFETILDELRGREREGDDLITTLDPRRAAHGDRRARGPRRLGRRDRAVDGRVRAMVSVPGYDPNSIPGQLLRPAPRARVAAAQPHRAERISARLDLQGRDGHGGARQRALHAPVVRRREVAEGDRRRAADELRRTSFGRITLTDALTNSVNTVWATVGETRRQADDVRVHAPLRVQPQAADRPAPATRCGPAASTTATAELLGDSDAVDIGRVAIGQERLQVTPLQMAMVASAIANGGSLMRPHLVRDVRDRDGRVVRREKPSEQSEVMKPSTASALAPMMSKVVEEGTGTAAALEGIDVAGKTGTAEVGAMNQAWFIGFAPVQRPRVAIAVTVERTTGQGGTVAAPIAKQVMQELLR